MGTKTRYREPNSPAQYIAEKIAEEIPASEKIPLDDQPAADAVKPPNDTLAETTDEATRRLRHQLAQLQQSEAMQRQAAIMPQRPTSREAKLQAWRAGGMSPEDERTLIEHPAMIDHHEITAAAAHEAAQQYERGTNSHRELTRELFDRHLTRLQTQAQPSAGPPPQFFSPPEPPPPRDQSPSIYSAPVSREVPSAGGREPSLRSITLSAEERSLAASLGLSETTYAKQKLEMLRRQKAGEIQK